MDAQADNIAKRDRFSDALQGLDDKEKKRVLADLDGKMNALNNELEGE